MILGSPVAGISADEELDPRPAIDAIIDRHIGSPEFSNLPRKFKTAISWQQDVAHEVNDVSFIGVVHPEHGPGFDVWVGGGLSTNPKIAQRLGAWVPLDEVPDVWAGIIAVFRDYGYRRLRHRARIKFLVADWGAAEFRRVLEEQYLGRPLADGPAPPTPAAPIDHIGVHRRSTGATTWASPRPPAGSRGAPWSRWPTPPRRPGRSGCGSPRSRRSSSSTCRTSTSTALTAELAALGLQAEPSPWRRATMACTGIEFCKLAIVETKERAIRLVDDLEKRLADVHPDVPLSIHLNGCPNSCARAQVADIGLKGQIVTDADGHQVEGFQVHLGGGLGLDAGFGRKLRGLKVTSAELADYVDRRRPPLRRPAHRGRAVRAVGRPGDRGGPQVNPG